MKITDKFKIVKGKVARNRIVMPPMDTTFTKGDGKPTSFHVQHYGARAYGGVGTIIVESTAVSSKGKILKKDLGLWNDEQIKGHKEIVKIAKLGGSIIGVQLNHAGSKAEMLDEVRTGATTFYNNYLSMNKFKLMTKKDLQIVIDNFVDSAKRAKESGYDFIEIHAAHGYLLSELIHPKLNDIISSKDILERAYIIVEIVERIYKEVSIPIGIRFSASDNEDNGMEPKDFKPLIEKIEQYIDYFNVSSGEAISKENVAKAIKDSKTKLYRLRLVEEFKKMTNKNIVMAGNVSTRLDVEEAMNVGVEGVAIGRELLFNPYLVVNTLLKPSEIDKETYHWNNNTWFNPADYSKAKDRYQQHDNFRK